jgi:hypothetical protein
MQLTPWRPIDPASIPPRANNALAKRLKESAANLDPKPGPQNSSEVLNLGEPLNTPVFWQGEQWAVTPYGVECRNGLYAIDADRLWQNEQSFGWVRHMATKEWVNLPDFAEALRVARRMTRVNPRKSRN